MTRFEYKVLPAPTRGQRGKGVKGGEGKFANAVEQVMNDMAADGWDYLRAETLPSEERAGLTSKTTVFRNLLIFRRALDTDASAFEPKLLDAPAPAADTEPSASTEPAGEIADETDADTRPPESAADTGRADAAQTGASAREDKTPIRDDPDTEDDEPASIGDPLRQRARQLSAKPGS